MSSVEIPTRIAPSSLGVEQLQLQHDLVGASILIRDRAHLPPPALAEQRLQLFRRPQHLPDRVRIAGGNDHAVHIGDRGVLNVARRQTRGEDRLQRRRGPQRRVGLDTGRDGVEEPVGNRVGDELRACVRLSQMNARQFREVPGTQEQHRESHEDGDARDLFGFDADVHG
jgi:hypothetical protein